MGIYLKELRTIKSYNIDDNDELEVVPKKDKVKTKLRKATIFDESGKIC